MAQISLAELIDVLKQHPSYRTRFELDVPAEQALYLSFSEREQSSVESSVLEIVDGHKLLIDQDRDGRVCGIEIV